MQLTASIIQEVKFRLQEESLPRIRKCFDQLTDEEIWTRPVGNLSSMGNLVLHLCGNVRQYILFGLDGQPDNRERQAEFDHDEIIPKDQLLLKLDDLMAEVNLALDKRTEEDLLRAYTVQGMDISGFGILMHVVEHFSYHVGQITWYTKMLKDMDLNYYGNKDLNITGK